LVAFLEAVLVDVVFGGAFLLGQPAIDFPIHRETSVFRPPVRAVVDRSREPVGRCEALLLLRREPYGPLLRLRGEAADILDAAAEAAACIVDTILVLALDARCVDVLVVARDFRIREGPAHLITVVLLLPLVTRFGCNDRVRYLLVKVREPILLPR